MGTDQKFMSAQQLIVRNQQVAKAENRTVKLYSLEFQPNGDISVNGSVVDEDRALEILEAGRSGKPAAAPAAAQIKQINTATKLFLKALALQIEECGTSTLILGSDIKVTPQDRPRLSNLKKMGYVVTLESKPDSHKRKELFITELGYEVLKG